MSQDLLFRARAIVLSLICNLGYENGVGGDISAHLYKLSNFTGPNGSKYDSQTSYFVGCDAKKMYSSFYRCFFHIVSLWEKSFWVPVHHMLRFRNPTLLLWFCSSLICSGNQSALDTKMLSLPNRLQTHVQICLWKL